MVRRLGSILTLVANAQEALPGPNFSCGSLRIYGIVASKREFATSVNIGVKTTKRKARYTSGNVARLSKGPIISRTEWATDGWG
jgi:hypothetical protein